MFVYHKLYWEPVSPTISTRRCGDQGKKHQVVCARQEAFVLFFIFLNECPPSLLANRPLVLQPQQARD